jgi:hypothetical protein
MAHVAIPEPARSGGSASQVFAGFRDDRELVQQLLSHCGFVCAKPLSSYRNKEKRFCKQEDVERWLRNTTTLKQTRHVRRNELHHANMAGKGGLWDLSSVKKERTGAEAEASPTAGRKSQPILGFGRLSIVVLEASRSIAQQWVEERNNDVTPKDW